MFYNEKQLCFVITGIYRVDSRPGIFVERGRAHTAISLRSKGNSRISGEDRVWEMKNGTMGFFPSGVDYVRAAAEPEEFIAIHMNCFGHSGAKIETVDGCDDLWPLFEELYEEWEKGGAASRNRCMRMLYEIFEKLSDRPVEKNEEIPAVIAAGVAYMREHFKSKTISIAHLASLCNISEVYFRRVYHGCFGESPMQTLLELRFQYAKDLLASGYYPTKTIADMAGFSDVKYFRTAFKKRFGITPAEFAAGR